ncbi:MAG: hypothetical protein ACTSXD_05080 [Candidatus Heimdallarchaeaceae archaeon]
MEIKTSYWNGYVYEEDGKTYLVLVCSKCKKSEKIWIVPTEGIIKRKCSYCGNENIVNLQSKEGFRNLRIEEDSHYEEVDEYDYYKELEKEKEENDNLNMEAELVENPKAKLNLEVK